MKGKKRMWSNDLINKLEVETCVASTQETSKNRRKRRRMSSSLKLSISSETTCLFLSHHLLPPFSHILHSNGFQFIYFLCYDQLFLSFCLFTMFIVIFIFKFLFSASSLQTDRTQKSPLEQQSVPWVPKMSVSLLFLLLWQIVIVVEGVGLFTSGCEKHFRIRVSERQQKKL
jgi:hypothetical protein